MMNPIAFTKRKEPFCHFGSLSRKKQIILRLQGSVGIPIIRIYLQFRTDLVSTMYNGSMPFSVAL